MPIYRLETREARRKLPPRHDVYWRSVGKALAVGYRNSGAKGSTPQWYVRRFRNGAYIKEAIGDTDDNGPGANRLSWQDALAKAMAPPKDQQADAKRYTVQDAFTAYWEYRRAEKRSVSSLEMDQERVAGFLEKFGKTRTSELTTSQLRAWRVIELGPEFDGVDETSDAERRDAKRARQATVNRTWSIVRAALTHAFNDGHIESDLAWRRIKPFPKVDAPRTRFLTEDEADKLLKKCSPQFRLLARAALLTGLRRGELDSLTPACVGDGVLYVPEGKTGKGRAVPLTPAAQAHFAALVKGKQSDDPLFVMEHGDRWYKMAISREMRSANKKAKLSPHATFHDLRRSFGSILANAKVNDAIIAAALGHADTRMTRRVYGHLMQETVAAEIARALPAFGSKPKTTRKASKAKKRAPAGT